MDKEARRLGRRMIELYRDLDPQVAAHAAKQGHTCREGCSHCCHLLTMVTLPEAVAVVDHVLAQPLGRVLLQAYQQRALAGLELYADRHDALTADDYWHEQIACPFLRNDRCTVYEARPAACRYHYVATDPDQCRGPEDHVVGKIDVTPAVDAALGVAMHAMKRAGIGFVIAPLPLMVIYAAALLLHGEAEFNRLIAAAPNRLLDLRSWQDALSVSDNGRLQIVSGR